MMAYTTLILNLLELVLNIRVLLGVGIDGLCMNKISGLRGTAAA